MRRNIIVFLGCLTICFGAYRFGATSLEQGKTVGFQQIYTELNQLMFPMMHLYKLEGHNGICEDMTAVLNPVLVAASKKSGQDKSLNQGDVAPIIESTTTESQESSTVISENTITVSGLTKQVEINRTKLQDFDFLRQNFYQVDSSTTVTSSLLNVEKLLEKDMSIEKGGEGPQVLIYHTHSQEAYKDSNGSSPETSIVAVGDYLTELLTEKYGLKVIHHAGVYDIPRNSAYSTALPHIEKILKENPSIEVVIDLHRDGVPDTMHLVSEVNGKPTAQLMFFNGLSHTTSKGDLDYLKNPYIEDNLAFSFQMQLAAEEYYPGLTRKIYLKGYRYNLHLCPKSALIEVGAQSNSFQEALNAMEPLANILAMVLLDES